MDGDMLTESQSKESVNIAQVYPLMDQCQTLYLSTP